MKEYPDYKYQPRKKTPGGSGSANSSKSNSPVHRSFKSKHSPTKSLNSTIGGNAWVNNSSKVRFSTTNGPLTSINHDRLNLRFTIDSKFKANLRKSSAKLFPVSGFAVEATPSPTSSSSLTSSPHSPDPSGAMSFYEEQKINEIKQSLDFDLKMEPFSPTSSHIKEENMHCHNINDFYANVPGVKVEYNFQEPLTPSSMNTDPSSAASSLDDLDTITDLLQIPPTSELDNFSTFGWDNVMTTTANNSQTITEVSMTSPVTSSVTAAQQPVSDTLCPFEFSSDVTDVLDNIGVNDNFLVDNSLAGFIS